MSPVAEIPKRITLIDIICGVFPLIPRIPVMIKSGFQLLMLRNSSPISMATLIERNSKKHPNRIALKSLDGDYTYREFDERANQYARVLLRNGIKKGIVVQVLLENRPELLFLFTALAKIGAIAAMTSTRLFGQQLLACFENSAATGLVAGEECMRSVEDILGEQGSCIPSIRFYIPDSKKRELPSGFINLSAEAKSEPKSSPDNLMKVTAKDPMAYLFTSGTSGQNPKAAIVTHKKFIMSSLWFGHMMQHTRSTDTVYSPLPLFHILSLCVGWPVALAGGASFAMRRRFSTHEFENDLLKFNATIAIYVGEIWSYIMQAPTQPIKKPFPLRRIIGNGLRSEIWNNVRKRYQLSAIYEIYGATESDWVFTNMLNRDFTIGFSPNRYAIVDCDRETGLPKRRSDGFLTRVDIGETGLLLFAISITQGYAGYIDSDATQSKIIQNGFRTGDRWFNTGDLVMPLGYGHARFIDRLGESFRWKGENVSTVFVESVLNRFPGIAASTVFGVRVPLHDGRAGMAVIKKSSASQAINLEELLKHLQANLPMWAIPRFLRITDAFEVTETNKIRKGPLADEGYDCSRIKDPLFVMDASQWRFVEIDSEMLRKIQDGLVVL